MGLTTPMLLDLPLSRTVWSTVLLDREPSRPEWPPLLLVTSTLLPDKRLSPSQPPHMLPELPRTSLRPEPSLLQPSQLPQHHTPPSHQLNVDIPVAVPRAVPREIIQEKHVAKPYEVPVPRAVPVPAPYKVHPVQEIVETPHIHHHTVQTHSTLSARSQSLLLTLPQLLSSLLPQLLLDMLLLPQQLLLLDTLLPQLLPPLLLPKNLLKIKQKTRLCNP